MSEIIITQDNFDQKVLKNDKTVLVDFWASWCAPCMMLSPIISEIAEENPDIVVGKVNVDEQPGISFQYGISSIPTLMVFKGGKMVRASVGLLSKEQILEMLK